MDPLQRSRTALVPDQARPGQRDRLFLERALQKLLLNFTWWVNRKDAEGNNIFEGGFLGKSLDAGEWIKVDGEPLWALRIRPSVFGGIHLTRPKSDPAGWGPAKPLAFPDPWGPINPMQGMVQLENPGGLPVEEKHPQSAGEIGVRVPRLHLA